MERTESILIVVIFSTPCDSLCSSSYERKINNQTTKSSTFCFDRQKIIYDTALQMAFQFTLLIKNNDFDQNFKKKQHSRHLKFMIKRKKEETR